MIFNYTIMFPNGEAVPKLNVPWKKMKLTLTRSIFSHVLLTMWLVGLPTYYSFTCPCTFKPYCNFIKALRPSFGLLGTQPDKHTLLKIWDLSANINNQINGNMFTTHLKSDICNQHESIDLICCEHLVLISRVIEFSEMK